MYTRNKTLQTDLEIDNHNRTNRDQKLRTENTYLRLATAMTAAAVTSGIVNDNIVPCFVL